MGPSGSALGHPYNYTHRQIPCTDITMLQLFHIYIHTYIYTTCMMCFAFSQSFDGFIRYLEQQRSTNFLCSMSDFHLLLFLYTTDVVQLQVDSELYTCVHWLLLLGNCNCVRCSLTCHRCALPLGSKTGLVLRVGKERVGGHM